MDEQFIASNQTMPPTTNQPPAPLEPISESPVDPPMEQTIKSKRSKKPLFLSLLVIILLAGVGYGVYAWQHGKNDKLQSQINSLQNQITDLQKNASSKSTSTTQTTDPYAGWKTYTSTTEKVSFKYPSTWTVTNTAGRFGDSSADSVDLKSPSGSITVSWASVVSGVGGACDAQATLGSSNSNSAVPCPQFNVFSKTAVSGASGLYVITASVTDEGTTYRPWMAVQDSNGILTSKRVMDSDFYQTKKTGKNYPVLFSINGTNGTSTGASYSSSAQTQAFFNGTEAQQAKLILLSLTY